MQTSLSRWAAGESCPDDEFGNHIMVKHDEKSVEAVRQLELQIGFPIGIDISEAIIV
jgi:hypothetical protein